jgi:hypothetical protein
MTTMTLIPCRKTPTVLSRDIEKIGYTIDRVAMFPELPARKVEVCLSNGVKVNFDRHAEAVLVTGPEEHRDRVEKSLRLLYEGNWFGRMLVFSPGLVAAAVFATLITAAGLIF